MAKFNVNLWESGIRYRKSDLIFCWFRISSNIRTLSDFLYFHSFNSKNCLKVKPLLQNVNFAKVVNFEPTFRGEGLEVEKSCWHDWKEEVLNFQNIKSDFLYLIPFSHKLTLNLANFRKFKCCGERNLDHFYFLKFWYETSFGKSN